MTAGYGKHPIGQITSHPQFATHERRGYSLLRGCMRLSIGLLSFDAYCIIADDVEWSLLPFI